MRLQILGTRASVIKTISTLCMFSPQNWTATNGIVDSGLRNATKRGRDDQMHKCASKNVTDQCSFCTRILRTKINHNLAHSFIPNTHVAHCWGYRFCSFHFHNILLSPLHAAYSVFRNKSESESISINTIFSFRFPHRSTSMSP